MDNQPDDYLLMCNTCKCIVEEDHICDYDNSTTDGIIENNNNNTTEYLENNNNSKNIGHNDGDLTEGLISEVFIREPLWNSKLPYKQRGPADIKLLWAQVDTCLGTDPGISQAKWKNMRDRFVKEYGIQNTYTASGSATKAKKTSTWYLYETLSFLIPTINYRKTKSNLENVNPNRQSMSSIQDSTPNTSYSREQDLSLQTSYRSNSNPENMIDKNLSQQSVLRPQSSECNMPVESSRINEVASEGSNRNNNKRLMSQSEVLQLPKSTKHMKKSNIPANPCLEEALLTELKQTRPTKEQYQSKPDKIESFVKYIEACLRGMTPEVSKLVMKQILNLLLEQDI
ncbi:uncharacterized protein [Temnothorax nylanderi]|uniref:uncharacterized protein isoform X1 n=1 Tax=Temnothorax nylanderi TaxID=102681 RepID=UPI003A84B4E5